MYCVRTRCTGLELIHKLVVVLCSTRMRSISRFDPYVGTAQCLAEEVEVVLDERCRQVRTEALHDAPPHVRFETLIALGAENLAREGEGRRAINNELGAGVRLADCREELRPVEPYGSVGRWVGELLGKSTRLELPPKAVTISRAYW